jgi:predicted nucleic acid-binding protein
MSPALRAVLDTNVLLAAARSTHTASPTAEILDRWQKREFQLLVSPSSAVQKVVFLISNDLRKISAVFLHYILHRF